MMKKIIMFLAFSCLLFSCDGNVVYKKYDENFPDNRWKKSDVRTYDFKIEKAGNYDLSVDFGHVYNVQFAGLPMKIDIVNPDQSKSQENFTLELKDSEGKDLGDCSGDYCDLRQPVFKNKKLEAGQYSVSISVSNTFGFDYFPNVLGLGIRVATSGN